MAGVWLKRFEIAIMDKASCPAALQLCLEAAAQACACVPSEISPPSLRLQRSTTLITGVPVNCVAWQVKKDTPFKQWLFHTAFKLKLAALKAGSPWDKARGQQWGCVFSS